MCIRGGGEGEGVSRCTADVQLYCRTVPSWSLPAWLAASPVLLEIMLIQDKGAVEHARGCVTTLLMLLRSALVLPIRIQCAARFFARFLPPK